MGRLQFGRNRATKSAELQAELAIGALRNAPERSGTLRPDLGPQIGRIASRICDRNAPERSGTPGRIWSPKSAGRPARPLRGPKSGHQIGRIASGIGDRNAPERSGALLSALERSR